MLYLRQRGKPSPSELPHVDVDVADEGGERVASRVVEVGNIRPQRGEAERVLGGAERAVAPGRARRTAHVVVADEIHEGEQRRHALAPEEVEVREAVGELVEPLHPVRPSLRPERHPRLVERPRDPLPRRALRRRGRREELVEMRLRLDQHRRRAEEPERIPLRPAAGPEGLQLRRERVEAEEAEEGGVAVLGEGVRGEGRQPADARKTGGAEEARVAVDGELEPAKAAAGAGRLWDAQI